MRSSGWEGSFNIANCILGSGVLATPYAMRQMGIYFGVVALLVVAYLNYFAQVLLVRIKLAQPDAPAHSATPEKPGLFSYEHLAYEQFGYAGKILTSFAMITTAYSSMVSYVIIIGDTFPNVLQVVADSESIWCQRTFVTLLVCIVFILPLCFFSSMSKLAFSSFIAVVLEIAIVLVLVINAQVVSASDSYVDDLEQISGSFFSGFGIILTAFLCTHQAFMVFSSLEDTSLRNWKFASAFAFTLSLGVMLLLAVLCYVAFGDYVYADILNNFTDTDIAANVARVLVGITMVPTFAIEHFVCRNAIAHISEDILAVWFAPTSGPSAGNTVWSTTSFVLTGLFVFITPVVTALYLNNLGLTLSLGGNVSASILTLMLPAALWFKSQGFNSTFQNSKFWAASASTTTEPSSVEMSATELPVVLGAEFEDKTVSPHPKSFFEKLGSFQDFWIPLFMLLLGLVALVIGSYASIVYN